MEKQKRQEYIFVLVQKIKQGNGFSLGEQEEKLKALCKYKDWIGYTKLDRKDKDMLK